MESETLREITPALEEGGRYAVLAEIKPGRLFLASKAGKRFVLKTSDGSAKGIEQLKREYELSIGLSHPGLAYIFTYENVSPVGPCLVQEYVDGETLVQWLGHGPRAKDRRRVAGELLSVMAYLHRKGVIHNDLKPENILISRSGGVLKLIDLGFADNDTYAAKALGGTRAYASPELLAGERVDARSDVYSIGLILRELAPGRYPGIVRRCLRKDAARRFASAGEVEKAWKRRNLPAWIALAVAIVIAFGGLTAAYLDTQKEFSALKEAESARAEALSAAKAQVDAWFDAEVPAYLEALSQAQTQDQVFAAWMAFIEKSSVVNTDIPSGAPEEVRPALRDYILERNNATYPALQDSLTRRLQEINR